jgi:hypothetical protein
MKHSDGLPLRRVVGTVVLILVVGLVGLSGRGVAQSGGSQYITIDDPNAIGTVPNGINDPGDIVGEYVDSTGNVHGVLLNGGTYTTIDVPNGAEARATSINSRGDIVGWYLGSCPTCTGVDGFLLSHGVYTNLDVPNAVATEAFGIGATSSVCTPTVLSRCMGFC